MDVIRTDETCVTNYRDRGPRPNSLGSFSNIYAPICTNFRTVTYLLLYGTASTRQFTEISHIFTKDTPTFVHKVNTDDAVYFLFHTLLIEPGIPRRK